MEVISWVICVDNFILAAALRVLLRVLGVGLDDVQLHLGLSRLRLQDRNGLFVGQLCQINAIDAQQNVP